MQKVEFDNAYYVKLGRGGKWEKLSIKDAKIRVGWKRQDINDILKDNWTIIEQQIRQEMGDSGAATRDLNALRIFCKSTSNDLWVTFYSSKLWWCQVKDGKIMQDGISKYREVEGSWSDKDINGKFILANQITGRLARLQAFRGTICKVKAIEDLERLINAETSPEYKAILENKKKLIERLEPAIRRLHWKDFEILVDLLFRQAGWRRISVIGETMKQADLELEETITGELYQVQVKSKASMNDFEHYANEFSNSGFRKLYFVVHSPEDSLLKYISNRDTDVELILPKRLATMVVDGGLINWVMEKIR